MAASFFVEAGGSSDSVDSEHEVGGSATLSRTSVGLHNSFTMWVSRIFPLIVRDHVLTTLVSMSIEVPLTLRKKKKETV